MLEIISCIKTELMYKCLYGCPKGTHTTVNNSWTWAVVFGRENTDIPYRISCFEPGFAWLLDQVVY